MKSLSITRYEERGADQQLANSYYNNIVSNSLYPNAHATIGESFREVPPFDHENKGIPANELIPAIVIPVVLFLCACTGFIGWICKKIKGEQKRNASEYQF